MRTNQPNQMRIRKHEKRGNFQIVEEANLGLPRPCRIRGLYRERIQQTCYHFVSCDIHQEAGVNIQKHQLY